MGEGGGRCCGGVKRSRKWIEIGVVDTVLETGGRRGVEDTVGVEAGRVWVKGVTCLYRGK